MASPREEATVDGASLIDSRDETAHECVLDTRAIPLDVLAADAEVQRMVTRILDNIEAPSRIRVAAFYSSI